MRKIKRAILKVLYKLLIFKVILIDRTNRKPQDTLKTFCEYEIMSNMGLIRFIFKEDYRKRRRKINDILFLNSFLVELKIPDEIVAKRDDVNNKAIVVIKLIIIKVNYEILAEVLLDTYIDNILKYIKNNPNSTTQIIK